MPKWGIIAQQTENKYTCQNGTLLPVLGQWERISVVSIYFNFLHEDLSKVAFFKSMFYEFYSWHRHRHPCPGTLIMRTWPTYGHFQRQMLSTKVSLLFIVNRRCTRRKIHRLFCQQCQTELYLKCPEDCPEATQEPQLESDLCKTTPDQVRPHRLLISQHSLPMLLACLGCHGGSVDIHWNSMSLNLITHFDSCVSVWCHSVEHSYLGRVLGKLLNNVSKGKMV